MYFVIQAVPIEAQQYKAEVFVVNKLILAGAAFVLTGSVYSCTKCTGENEKVMEKISFESAKTSLENRLKLNYPKLEVDHQPGNSLFYFSVKKFEIEQKLPIGIVKKIMLLGPNPKSEIDPLGGIFVAFAEIELVESPLNLPLIEETAHFKTYKNEKKLKNSKLELTIRYLETSQNLVEELIALIDMNKKIRPQ